MSHLMISFSDYVCIHEVLISFCGTVHLPTQINAIARVIYIYIYVSLRHVPLCQLQWSCNVYIAKHHVPFQKIFWVAMPPWRPLPIYIKRHEPNHRSIKLTARTHTKWEGQSSNCKASEIVHSETWSCQNTFPSCRPNYWWSNSNGCCSPAASTRHGQHDKKK